MSLTRNVLGPLTTTFIPDPSCAVPVIYCPGTTECYAWQAQTCIGGAVDQSFCWPSWTRGAATSTSPGPLDGWGLYSPGLICPTGHTPACSTTFGGQGNFQFQFPLTADETAIGCCPSGYYCKRDVRQTCVFTATSTTYPGVVCDELIRSSTEFTVPGTYTATFDDDGVTEIPIATQTMYAPLFQLNWRAVDISLVETSSADNPSDTSGGQSRNQTTEEGGGGVLPIGAKAGIGAGVGILALLIIGVLLWWWKSKRRGYQDVLALESPPPPPPPELHNKHVVEASASPIYNELPNSLGTRQAQVWELDARVQWELDARVHVELDARPQGQPPTSQV